MGSLESPSGTHRTQDSKGILSKPGTKGSSDLGRFPGSRHQHSRAPPLPHVSQQLWAVATIPRNRSRQAGQMEAITRAGKAERRWVGRGLKGRRAVVRSRASDFPTERDEKPNSGLDLS